MRAPRLAVTAGLVAISACGAQAGSKQFGDRTTTCDATVLSNDLADREMLARGSACFVAEHEAGRAVVWDVLVPTVEGDPLVWRFETDGETVIITEDQSRDEFGSAGVTVRECAAVSLSAAWLPEGSNCSASTGDGFADDGIPTG